MNLDNPTSRVSIVAVAIGIVFAMAVQLYGQEAQVQRIGMPEDWTHKHVIFSNPGSFAEAMKNRSFERWTRIANDPRFVLQQMKRDTAMRRMPTGMNTVEGWIPELGDTALAQKSTPIRMHRDWSVSLGGGGVVATMYPAKFSFNVNAPGPDCTNDYVVFPINATPSGTQANIVGLINLYSSTGGTGFCSGTGPTFKFAYQVGAFAVKTSPILSLDGTKVAFIESASAAAKFHVLKIGTTGSNGTNATSPVTPGTGNNAVDTAITMNGGVSVTNSSIFVNYGTSGVNDVAYVGDDSGKLHKFTGVFLGTPAEVTTGGWPITVASGVILTGPIFDGVTKNIFIGGNDGNLYYVRESGSTSGACSSGSPPCLGGHISMGNTGGGPSGIPIDPPILDSSTGRVFWEAGSVNNDTSAALLQADTALGNVVTVNAGQAGNNGQGRTVIHDGAFDNNYFNSPSTGFMYFCGKTGSAGAQNPTLFRVGFNSSGVMNATKDPNDTSPHEVVLPGTKKECSPITEVFNPNGPTAKDWLFVGDANGSIQNFDITSSFPSAATQTATESGGTSGIIVDNVAMSPLWQATHSYALNTLITDSNSNVQKCTTAGTSGSTQPTWNTTVGGTTNDGSVVWTNEGPNQTSSVYFGTLSVNTAVKLTQAGLQ